MMLDDLEDITPVGVDKLGTKQVTLKTKAGGKTAPKKGSTVIIKADSPTKIDEGFDDYDDEEEYQEDDDDYDEEEDNTRTSAKEMKQKSIYSNT